MRISDWSSDVCSSDLARRQTDEDTREAERLAELRRAYNAANGIVEEAPAEATEAVRKAVRGHSRATEAQPLPVVDRSEEHTSELQSLMRISYAVFCMKKKKK